MNAAQRTKTRVSIDSLESLIASPSASPAKPPLPSPAISSTNVPRNPSPIRRFIDPATRRPGRSISPGKRASIVIPAHAPVTSASKPGSSVPQFSTNAKIEEQDSETTESDILTALAAQERQVLELKEGLHKAEEELQRLKKQYAHHQSTKRHNEVRRMHQMRPVNTSSVKKSTTNEDVDGSSAWMYEEMERRKALLGNSKTSHRRVFSGSRETKTLSLLSPENPSATDRPNDILDGGLPDNTGRRSRDIAKRPTSKSTPGSTAAASWERNERYTEPDSFARRNSRSPHRSPERDDILRAGRQVATDLRDGFWTFFEDLRQAAVGDEAMRPGPEFTSARASSKRVSPGRKPAKHDSAIANITDEGGSFWEEHGLSEPTPKLAKVKPSKTRTPQKPPPQARSLEDPPWDPCDIPKKTSNLEPSPARSNSTASASRLNEEGSPASLLPSSPDTSVTSSTNATPRATSGPEQREQRQMDSKHRDAIPWPALTKLTPGQLVRSASNLMEEWERSLTPSPSATPSGEPEEDGTLSRANVHDGYVH